MMRRIYTDTSVIGGCLDSEFSEHSNRLFNRFHAGLDTLVISNLTLGELEPAPPEVRALFQTVPVSVLEEVYFDSSAAALALEYHAARVISEAHLVDARHIATASVQRVDILVSWNFKHIVNLDRIRGYNSVNLRFGYPLLEIRSPREILRDED